MIQVCYTSSNTEDVWDMFYEQNKRHCSYPLYLLTDKVHQNKKYKNVYIYKNTLPYWKAWVQTLEDIKDDYFIYLQEDFVLYNDVNSSKIEEYTNFLKNNKEYSFVRLLKSGNNKDKEVYKNLFEIKSDADNIFSMQPTIWRKKDFINLYTSVKSVKWFENQDYINKCKDLNIRGVYHFDNEKKRGQNHYDSNVYPYIATALVKGCWNISEYPNELSTLLYHYNINANQRGII